MKWLKCIFDFYLDASIHVASSVVSLLYVTSYFFELKLSVHLAYFIFFGTIACYNFVKYGVEAKKYILVANQYHKNIQFASFIALIFVAYHAYFLSKEVWVAVGIMSILIGLYALPLLPNTKNLRNFGGLKIILVGLVWAGSTVLLPLVSQKMMLTWDVWIAVFQRILLILILLIPFEIRDLKYDTPEMLTMPQRYGVFRSKTIGVVMVLVFFATTFLKDDIQQLELISKGLLTLALGIVMMITVKNQKKYFCSFWVEAIPILWLGSVWLLEQIL